MRNIRNVLFALIVVAGVSANASSSGIEVLRVSGIEVLTVDTHSWGAPPGCWVHAVMDLGAGPVIVGAVPVNPVTGDATVIFPLNHPNNRVELRDHTGLLIDAQGVTQWD